MGICVFGFEREVKVILVGPSVFFGGPTFG